MPCKDFGKKGHNAKTCKKCQPRVAFTSTVKSSTGKRCQCCGKYNGPVESHHAKGRGINAQVAHLSLCKPCHLECGHDGDFRNAPIKPEKCRRLGTPSHWRPN